MMDRKPNGGLDTKETSSGEDSRPVNPSLYSESRSSFRHRNGSSATKASNTRVFKDEENAKMKYYASQRPKSSIRRLEVACQSYRQRCPLLCNRFSNLLCCASFLIWLLAFLFQQRIDPVLYSELRDSKPVHGNTRPKAVSRPVQDIVRANPLRPHGRRARKPVCVQSDWHSYSFPNCNDLHDIDLESIKQRRHRDPNNKSDALGYLTSGYWRDIWAVDPRASVTTEPIVLKIMRSEHDDNTRNFDRHRRDALVMERLTSSPNIVDIYGYCGNSMLTEYIPTTILDIIFRHFKKSNVTVVPTRETAVGRLRLALDAARSIQAIHEIPGGPIVHADVSVSQFLVRDNGIVALNDFNRCRFMEHDNRTGKLCSFRISTAPGNFRSPEEYNKKELDAKLDVYSLANVLYSILTGRMPRGRTPEAVVNGTIPVIPDDFRQPGTIDEAMSELIYRAYKFDPKERISASELVTELEKLMTKLQQLIPAALA